ncbi:FtsB family cell division protein [Thermostaphylospora chromogena]|uniref:Septum formation initiator n=1 Tax=Thermostaphylospora chromogena TaxID=35622 RepID=A0A1H1B8Y6_9ACTN|nr:septum formation initiator family protein [Thermostaphylospora chromogena]SDQ48397.1 hypothetical protein SAMN04489764_0855 [Thermostaphylospora chromogena]
MAGRPQLTGRAAILAIVVCAIAMSLAYPVREYIAQRRELIQLREEQERELAALRAAEERGRQLLDPNYSKKLARERLFYCDPGQKCFVVMPDEQERQKKREAEDGGGPARQLPWYEALWKSVEAADGSVTSGKSR